MSFASCICFVPLCLACQVQFSTMRLIPIAQDSRLQHSTFSNDGELLIFLKSNGRLYELLSHGMSVSNDGLRTFESNKRTIHLYVYDDVSLWYLLGSLRRIASTALPSSHTDVYLYLGYARPK